MFNWVLAWTKCPNASFRNTDIRLDLHILFDATFDFLAEGAVQNNRLLKTSRAHRVRGLWQYVGKGETVQNLHERLHGVPKLALQGARTRKTATVARVIKTLGNKKVRFGVPHDFADIDIFRLAREP